MFSISLAFSQSKGDIIIGANSSLSTSRLVDLRLLPTVGYQVNDAVQVGAGITVLNSPGSDYNSFSIYARYYPKSCVISERIRSFFQLSGGVSPTHNTTAFGVDVGVTAFLNKWFFVEPRLGWDLNTFEDQNISNLGMSLGFGVRLN